MMIQKNSKMPQKMMKKGKKTCCKEMLVGGVTEPKPVKKSTKKGRKV